jgi:quercetin dioxygenase-like cupin family protein
MTFADYEFTAGSIIHEHFHAEEEVYQVIAGELEMAVDGVTDVVRPGIVAIVPSNARHSVRALTDGRVIQHDLTELRSGRVVNDGMSATLRTDGSVAVRSR